VIICTITVLLFLFSRYYNIVVAPRRVKSDKNGGNGELEKMCKRMNCKNCGSPKQKCGPWEFYECGCEE